MQFLKNNKTMAVATGAAILVTIGGVGGAVAANTIGTNDIRDGAVHSSDLFDGGVQKEDIHKDAVGSSEVIPGSIGFNQLSDNVSDALAQVGEQGPPGVDGVDGVDGVSGYEVQTYDYIKGQDGDVYGAGDAAIATVACSSPDKVAVTGGYWMKNSEAMTDGTAVIASFPGRMNWDATPAAPFPNRYDGWIVQLNIPVSHIGRDLTMYVVCVDAN